MFDRGSVKLGRARLPLPFIGQINLRLCCSYPKECEKTGPPPVSSTCAVTHGVLRKQDPLVGALPNQIQQHFAIGHALFPALAEVTQVHAFWEAPVRRLRPVLTLCRCQLNYCTGRYACGKAGDCVQSDDL